MGLDTVEANERLGFPCRFDEITVWERKFLTIWVLKQIRLITNNPRKIAGLKGYGLEIVDRLPLLIEATDYNSGYLATKAKKLGHLLLQTYLITVAITLPESISVEARYEKLDKIRHLAQQHDFLVQEEARPIAVALFSNSSLIFHLGFDQSNLASPDWYQDCNHPYLSGIVKILDKLGSLPDVNLLEFLIASGDDPMTKLQIKLDRQNYKLGETISSFCNNLETQTIYSFTK